MVKKNLVATNSLPKINKKLINDIFATLLINEQRSPTQNTIYGDRAVSVSMSNSLELNKINMITMDRRGKSKKYLSGCSDIKNTGYRSYDILKSNIDIQAPSSSHIDIVSHSSGPHMLKGLKNKKKKLYGK